MSWVREGEYWSSGRSELIPWWPDGGSDQPARWVAAVGDVWGDVCSTVAAALASAGAPPVPVCSCGWPLERGVGPRERLCGALLEYCPCSDGCGSTTTVEVESCGHAAVQRSGPWELQRCECVECGHVWVEVPAA